jgi:hypothetical protein
VLYATARIGVHLTISCRVNYHLHAACVLRSVLLLCAFTHTHTLTHSQIHTHTHSLTHAQRIHTTFSLSLCVCAVAQTHAGTHAHEHAHTLALTRTTHTLEGKPLHCTRFTLPSMQVTRIMEGEPIDPCVNSDRCSPRTRCCVPSFVRSIKPRNFSENTVKIDFIFMAIR